MENPKGFSYTLSDKRILDYRTWPMERRLNWLLLGNNLRKDLPAKTIALQEKFRQAKL